MNFRPWLIAALLSMPLCGWQASDKPSPVPSKSRKPRPATRAQEKSNRLPANTAKPDGSLEPGQPPQGDSRGQTGEACFFSSRANGGLTASGSRLNSEDLVAGHASYPFGSRVRVTNLGNHRSVEVIIVDRLPPSLRIINVSEAAARQLDFTSSGTAHVRLELLSKQDKPEDSAQGPSTVRK